jgi:hypothetical protein
MSFIKRGIETQAEVMEFCRKCKKFIEKCDCEDNADAKIAKKRLADKNDPLLTLDEFKREIKH